MTRTFIELPWFMTKWKSLGMDDADLRRLQSELLSDPKVGAVMRGTGGVRKMRFAFKYQGKSGSIRVIYVDFEVYEKIYLLTAYTKNEKDNRFKSGVANAYEESPISLVEKGDELGYFLFGGSDFVLVFQKDAGFRLSSPKDESGAWQHILMGEKLGELK